MIYFTVFTVLGSGGGGGGGMVVNNTLQLKLFRRKGIQYTQLVCKRGGGGGEAKRAKQCFKLFCMKNFSSICLYCIIFVGCE